MCQRAFENFESFKSNGGGGVVMVNPFNNTLIDIVELTLTACARASTGAARRVAALSLPRRRPRPPRVASPPPTVDVCPMCRRA